MSNSGDYRPIPATTTTDSTMRPAGGAPPPSPVAGADPRLSLLNLSTVRARMDSVQRFLSDSIHNNTLIGKDQMDMVSTEIASAIHQLIVSGTALISCSQSPNLSIVSKLPQSANPIASASSIANILNANSLSDSDLNFKSCDSVNLSELDLKFKSCEENIKISNDKGGDILKFNSCEGDVSNDKGGASLKVEAVEEEMNDDWEIIELDAVELLAEHIHFCDICGKGFKRDANLRMHMRAHGNQFKTPEALAKPEKGVVSRRRTRFSCPFVGCNRNKLHKKFRPLKSVICVKNHFKRSHCPKMYSCNRCNKKSFSVVADLKSHLKHCGETKWKCSCGTSFSRKDKLFGHMALFEGHMPTVVEEDEKASGVAVMVTDEEDEDVMVKGMELGGNCSDNGFFDGLLDGFGSIDSYCFQDVFGSSPNGGLCNGMDWDL